MKTFYIINMVIACLLLISACSDDRMNTTLTMTTDDGTRLIIPHTDLKAGTYHTRHAEMFSKYIDGYNLKILEGIDIVQATAPDGGGYFASIKAVPPEAPIGYQLKLFNKALFEPQRSTSYCSGSTYAALVEGLNLLYSEKKQGLALPQFEALCMKEEDGGRREDNVKFWGKWNDDGYGNHFALVQYSKMGKKINPINARPGDFMNISWKKGGGHSVIFLGWHQDSEGKKNLLYWSSQTRTNGLGDELIDIDRIREVMTVRIAAPNSLFTFNVDKEVNRNVAGNNIIW
jgi:hypothetical protein